MYPQLGLPQLYHDQINIIGKHLWGIKNNPARQKKVNESIVQPDIHTLKSLKKVVFMDVSWGELQIFHSGYIIAALKKRKRLTRRRLQLQDD